MQGRLTSSSPQVSVVIPTYNRAAVVGRALTSVLTQTFSDLECIIVDDGSTDETVTLVERFRDPRLRVLRLPVNRGASHARNTGIQAAVGELVAFLDSDDEWLPQMLERQVQRLRASTDPHTGAVYCLAYRYDGVTRRLGSYRMLAYEGDVFGHLLRGWHPSTTSQFLVKRSLLLKMAGFDEELLCGEDYDLWLRLGQAHNHFAVVAERLVIKYDYGDQQMTTNPEIANRASEILDRKWGPVIQRHQGWVGYRRWRRERWGSVQLTHFRRIKVAMTHGWRTEAWRYWLGMCRLLPRSRRYVCSALLMIILGFHRYYLLVHTMEAVRRSMRDPRSAADTLTGSKGHQA